MGYEDRTPHLLAAIRERILVFDGAMGTSIQQFNLKAEDFGGPEYEGCNEYLVITRPQVIADVHRGYLDAGADVIETNTFGSTRLVLNEFSLGHRAHEITRAAAALASDLARGYGGDRPRFVAGSMGPTTRSISVTGGVTFTELVEEFAGQAQALIEGGVDMLLLETQLDTLTVKAGIVGVRQAQERMGSRLPLMASCTIENMGTMLAGQDVDAFYTSVEHAGLLSVGLNCATGPEFMTDHLRTLAGMAPIPVSCIPNAGLPNPEDGSYHESPEMLAAALARFVDAGWVNVIGGCCGTTKEHIAALAAMARGRAPRVIPQVRRTAISGIEYLEVTEDMRPVIVGERTNVVGSRKFKQLITAGQFEEAAEIGRLQVRKGAHVVDVCMADPERDEPADMITFLDRLTRKIKAPLMIDSTDARVIEEALQRTQGKCVVNSINLEDGEERFQAVVPLLRSYGGAVVVGCIDEDPIQGMAVTRERKLAVAQRSYQLLTTQYGLQGEDLIFDPLVFPVGTGDQNYIGSAAETIAGIKLIKEALPDVKTILGISNVSFGLPAASREVLNSVFLYHCTKAGLDMAIVNSEKLERYASIPETERQAAEDLIFWRGDDPVATYSALFRDRKVKQSTREDLHLSVDERLGLNIIEGSKERLEENLEEARLKYASALDIINGPLMIGMAEVGRLFNDNELIVAEVLQSAEAMKAAVNYLERYMTKADGAAKATLLLATVKGDVHDIGKNLVDIVLSNNGFKVINLGIKIPPEALIAACHEHKPDMIGLSGLLVKSAQQMTITAGDLAAAGIDVPILVGGAALSERYTLTRIGPAYGNLVCYAKDAMNGLDLANQLADPAARAALTARIGLQQGEALERMAAPPAPAAAPASGKPGIDRQVPVQAPPDIERHVLTDYDVAELFRYVNPVALYNNHLGLRGGPADRLIAQGDAKALKLRAQVEEFENRALAEGWLKARAVYRFFPARAEGDSIVIYGDASGKQERARLVFPRQAHGDRLCVADFLREGALDYLAMFVVTCGEGVRDRAGAWKDAGRYSDSHLLQALAIESAEGFAELLHQKLRAMWGFADAAGMTMKERFQARYRGVRVSFGYPACPRLEDQATLFELLRPEDIGVRLTDGFMMDPEASVSALAFHHPQGRYFAIKEEEQAEFERRMAEENRELPRDDNAGDTEARLATSL